MTGTTPGPFSDSWLLNCIYALILLILSPLGLALGGASLLGYAVFGGGAITAPSSSAAGYQQRGEAALGSSEPPAPAEPRESTCSAGKLHVSTRFIREAAGVSAGPALTALDEDAPSAAAGERGHRRRRPRRHHHHHHHASSPFIAPSGPPFFIPPPRHSFASIQDAIDSSASASPAPTCFDSNGNSGSDSVGGDCSSAASSIYGSRTARQSAAIAAAAATSHASQALPPVTAANTASSTVLRAGTAAEPWLQVDDGGVVTAFSSNSGISGKAFTALSPSLHSHQHHHHHHHRRRVRVESGGQWSSSSSSSSSEESMNPPSSSSSSSRALSPLLLTAPELSSMQGVASLRRLLRTHTSRDASPSSSSASSGSSLQASSSSDSEPHSASGCNSNTGVRLHSSSRPSHLNHVATGGRPMLHATCSGTHDRAAGVAPSDGVRALLLPSVASPTYAECEGSESSGGESGFVTAPHSPISATAAPSHTIYHQPPIVSSAAAIDSCSTLRSSVRPLGSNSSSPHLTGLMESSSSRMEARQLPPRLSPVALRASPSLSAANAAVPAMTAASPSPLPSTSSVSGTVSVTASPLLVSRGGSARHRGYPSPLLLRPQYSDSKSSSIGGVAHPTTPPRPSLTRREVTGSRLDSGSSPIPSSPLLVATTAGGAAASSTVTGSPFVAVRAAPGGRQSALQALQQQQLIRTPSPTLAAPSVLQAASLLSTLPRVRHLAAPTASRSSSPMLTVFTGTNSQLGGASASLPTTIAQTVSDAIVNTAGSSSSSSGGGGSAAEGTASAASIERGEVAASKDGAPSSAALFFMVVMGLPLLVLAFPLYIFAIFIWIPAATVARSLALGRRRKEEAAAAAAKVLAHTAVAKSA